VLVTGLQFTGVIHERTFIDTINIPDPPKPPPPPPVDQIIPETPSAPDFIAPKPPVDLSDLSPVQPREFDPLVIPDPVTFTQPAREFVEVPRPTPSFAPKGARPRNDVSRWVMTDDYPRTSLVRGSEGVTGFRVVVGSDGKVDACEITASSGDPQLDAATCRNVTRRARFEPATDGNGDKVVGSFRSNVRWQIPD
jgi:protein TonB